MLKPVASNPKKAKAEKKWTWKKPKDKPKRPLSAYNIFFRYEREMLLQHGDSGSDAENEEITIAVAKMLGETSRDGSSPRAARSRPHRKGHGKIGFANLAKTIADKWKTLDRSSRTIFEAAASIEKKRYKEALDRWNKQKAAEAAGAIKLTTNHQQHAQVTKATSITPPISLSKKEHANGLTAPKPVTCASLDAPVNTLCKDSPTSCSFSKSITMPSALHYPSGAAICQPFFAGLSAKKAFDHGVCGSSSTHQDASPPLGKDLLGVFDDETIDFLVEAKFDPFEDLDLLEEPVQPVHKIFTANVA